MSVPQSLLPARVLGVLAALLTTAAVLLAPAPAYAEGSFCEQGQPGVNVVVDFQDLGGGVRQVCAEDGAGKTAAQVFADSGFDLTPVGAFPGAACQVDGKPAEATCAEMPPADAYWGLFEARDGRWDYASKGADQLELADGSFVGFSWQSSAQPTPPGAEAVAAAPGSSSADEPADEPAADQASEEAADDGGVPWWVPVLVVVALLAAGAAVAVRRRGASA